MSKPRKKAQKATPAAKADPIFAVIGAHRKARALSFDAGVASDLPRGAKGRDKLDRIAAKAVAAECRAAARLLRTRPTTIEGITTLLVYAASYLKDGNEGPDVNGFRWEAELCERVAGALYMWHRDRVRKASSTSAKTV